MTAGKALAGLLGAIVAAAIVGGILVSGTPSEARATRLDERRVEDLTWLSAGVRTFHTRESTMPASLADLEAAGIPNGDRTDPEHGAAYDYRVIDGTRYELCATFSTESRQTRAVGQVFWSHRAGRECFALDADRRERWPAQ